jgi:addiction module HigA family antidote
MLDNNLPPHPGEILIEEFLGPLGLTQTCLAEKLGIPIQRINEIARGKRGITSETAWLLAGAFDISPQFWMNLQVNYDLATSRPQKLIGSIRPVAAKSKSQSHTRPAP